MKTKTGKKCMTDHEVQEIARQYVAQFNTAGEGSMGAQLKLGRLKSKRLQIRLGIIGNELTYRDAPQHLQ